MNEYLNKKKSSGDYGRRETLPPSLQTKMNQSFGMDFSSVKLYRNDEMSGTGMHGLASGNRVILSKDVDLNSKLGQAVLGHELSHIRAQSQGIGMGHSGLLNNAALERQADAEGLMAANGQPIFGDRTGMNMGAGMGGFGTLTPLSGGLAANAGAPMQAIKDKKDEMGKSSLGEKMGLRPAYIGKNNPRASTGIRNQFNDVSKIQGIKKSHNKPSKSWWSYHKIGFHDANRKGLGMSDVSPTTGYEKSGPLMKFIAWIFNLGNSPKNISKRANEEVIESFTELWLENFPLHNPLNHKTQYKQWVQDKKSTVLNGVDTDWDDWGDKSNPYRNLLKDPLKYPLNKDYVQNSKAASGNKIHEESSNGNHEYNEDELDNGILNIKGNRNRDKGIININEELY